MLEAFVITLREGVEVALIVGIIYAFLNKINRRNLHRAVNWGLYGAIGASILGAVVFQHYRLNLEAFEGVIMLVAAFLVGTLMIWIWRHSRDLKKNIELKVTNLVNAGANQEAFLSKEFLGLFAFTFVMVLREGIETVIFLSAVSLSTQGVFTFFGGMTGLILAVALGVFFVKGSLRINLSRFFAVTGVVLAIFLVQLLVNGYHELAEQQVIPAGPAEMAFVGPIVRYNILFIVAILSIPFVCFLISKKQDSSLEILEATGVQRRKLLAQARKQQRWFKLANGLAFGILVFLIISFVSGRTSIALTPAEPVQAVDGTVRIPVTALDDGILHRYGYMTDEGINVRFLGIKTKTGEYRVALDVCAICGDYGYYQEGNLVICINCDAPINISTIGTGGGCNPMEIAFIVQQDEVLINEADLNDAAVNFTPR
jgi:FTR1 family protein